MEEVSAIGFGDPDTTVDDHPISTFATCQESRNTYNDTEPANDFMGPALWPGDLDLFAAVNQIDGTLGSHIDMLHQSPLCMGIAHEGANRYWVFDGSNERLTWYDFQVPHGYGGDDHSDGKVRRYEDVILRRVPDVPGHLEVAVDGTIFVADTGNGRVLHVDPAPAVETDPLVQFVEPLAEFAEYRGAVVDELVTGLTEPSGLLLSGSRLFVSDHATGEILAFDAATGDPLGSVDVGAGVMGLAIGPDGRIWFTNGDTDEMGRIRDE
jgi:outer membrane protein assembly factor BamB